MYVDTKHTHVRLIVNDDCEYADEYAFLCAREERQRKKHGSVSQAQDIHILLCASGVIGDWNIINLAYRMPILS